MTIKRKLALKIVVIIIQGPLWVVFPAPLGCPWSTRVFLAFSHSC